ncbi:MAG: hypothetical protein OXG39_11580 [Chloroflexi bacterium]|nr:hypothetical protein [Chloroflexota bacterium]
MSEEREPAMADRTYAVAEVEGAYFVGRQSGLYRLAPSNGGARNLYRGWQPEAEIATLDIATSPRYGKDGLIMTGINGGVARSEDGGASWTALAMRMPAPLVTCLALSPSFASDRRVLAGSYEDGMFLSDDAGESWAPFNFGLFDHNIFCLALSPDFPVDGLVMAGTSSGVYRSANGGRLWADLTMPSGDEAVLSLAFSPEYADDRTILAGTESQGLLRSDDEGLTWEPFHRCEGAVNSIVCLPTVAGLAIQVDDSVLAYETGDGRWRQVAAAGVHVAAKSEDGRALLLGMADGSVRRILMEAEE